MTTINKGRKLPIGKILRYLVLVVIGIVFLIPLIWMLLTSLYPDDQVMSGVTGFLPREVHFENYARAIVSFPFLRYLWNTSWLTVVRLIGTLFTGALSAYAFSKLKWRGRDAIFAITIATLFLPSQVLLVPTYLMFSKIKWVNTYLPLIVPSFLGGGAFAIFMLKQYFVSLPDELLESGRIDGANEFLLFRKILLPLSIPALLSLGIFSFIFSWNDFIGPLIYLLDPLKWTLPIGLRAFQQKNLTEWNLLMAASTLTSLPLVVAYFFAQDSFMRGFTVRGGIK